MDGAQYIYTVSNNSDRLSIVRKGQTVQDQPHSATKFIRDAHMYIRIDGALYDANGRKIE